VNYQDFLGSKVAMDVERGHAGDVDLNPCLKPHQRAICEWAIRGGNRAIFADFGLGKTLMQIQVVSSLLAEYEGSGLIICPLGVKQEFARDAASFFGITFEYIRSNEEHATAVDRGQRFFITNYERVRDDGIDPNRFTVVSLDEASVLRSFGSKTYQSFLTLFDDIKFKFVCTATPSPNRFKELIHYAGFLGVMDTGQALTRFFKRDSEQAGNLQLYPHKEREFWLWVSSWAAFLTKPSDLGFSDDGYDLPPLRLHEHRLQVDHAKAGFDSWGQGKLLRDAAISLQEAAREKRDSLPIRIAKAKAIIGADSPDRHWIIWHDLEDERHAIQAAFPEAVTVYGTQDLDERERAIADFSDGKFRILATKPIIAGSGCNFQRHCSGAIYLGVNYKFNDFIQSVHRLYRFLQPEPVDIHAIYTESEDAVFATLRKKWQQHVELRERMAEIIRQYGLDNELRASEMRRQMVTDRIEESGRSWTAVNSDCVQEARQLADQSIDLVVTSWPFSDQYEYTPTYNDFGHNAGDGPFFKQMEYLTPEIVRALKPGRLYCVHAKDRMVFGSVSGDGMYSVNEFSDKCVAHLKAQGLRYMGRITIVTDVVRENNQTYRLGWTEQCKDGTKMGCGMPEYVLLFRKLPTDRTRSYADDPVRHVKTAYTRARWQFDAHGFWRSSGDRFLSPEEIRSLDFRTLRKIWHQYDGSHIYDYSQHVELAEALESDGKLPSSFMLLDPVSKHPDVWDDVVRMRTLNTSQSQRRQESHTCPLQLDIVERLIERFSNPGDLVMDPFGGIGTVAYCAVKMGRRGYTIELSPEYHADAVSYLRAVEQNVEMPTLFAAIKESA
jgi:DNA modification methylase